MVLSQVPCSWLVFIDKPLVGIDRPTQREPRNLTEFQWAKKQLHGPDYWPTWPSVANWLMPQSRAAGLQYDQKVNNKLGLFCGKQSIKITTAVIKVWCASLRDHYFVTTSACRKVDLTQFTPRKSTLIDHLLFIRRRDLSDRIP